MTSDLPPDIIPDRSPPLSLLCEYVDFSDAESFALSKIVPFYVVEADGNRQATALQFINGNAVLCGSLAVRERYVGILHPRGGLRGRRKDVL